MKKLNRTHWELIALVAIVIVFIVVFLTGKLNAFDRGYEAGLAKGNNDCNTKIRQSIQTIQEDAKEKQKIFNEPANDAYDRFKRNTRKK